MPFQFRRFLAILTLLAIPDPCHPCSSVVRFSAFPISAMATQSAAAEYSVRHCKQTTYVSIYCLKMQVISATLFTPVILTDGRATVGSEGEWKDPDSLSCAMPHQGVPMRQFILGLELPCWQCGLDKEKKRKSDPVPAAGRLVVARRFNGGKTEQRNPSSLPKARAQHSGILAPR